MSIINRENRTIKIIVYFTYIVFLLISCEYLRKNDDAKDVKENNIKYLDQDFDESDYIKAVWDTMRLELLTYDNDSMYIWHMFMIEIGQNELNDGCIIAIFDCDSNMIGQEYLINSINLVLSYRNNKEDKLNDTIEIDEYFNFEFINNYCFRMFYRKKRGINDCD